MSDRQSLVKQLFRAAAWIAPLVAVVALVMIALRPAAVADEAASVAADSGSGPASAESTGTTADAKPEKFVPKTKAQLRQDLSRIQYDVTQNEATEPAFRNRYWDNKKEGKYNCIVCDQHLFDSKTKYKSGTGWPSFFAPTDDKAVGLKTDWKLFYSRTEVHCSRCKAHLGHVFNDGPAPTGKRYCMNSASMKFIDADAAKED